MAKLTTKLAVQTTAPPNTKGRSRRKVLHVLREVLHVLREVLQVLRKVLHVLKK